MRRSLRFCDNPKGAPEERYPCPLDEIDLVRRRRTPLTARQHALLERRGHPYVFDEFRLHYSLTGPCLKIVNDGVLEHAGEALLTYVLG